MIQLNNKWALKFTELSVDVYEKFTNKKTGKKYYKPRFFYPNLQTALDGIIDRSLVDCESWKEVVERIKELKQEIRDLLKKNSEK